MKKYQNRWNVLCLLQFWRYKEGRPHFEKSWIDILYVIQQSEIKDDFQVVSNFPSLLGHPIKARYLKTWPVHQMILMAYICLNYQKMMNKFKIISLFLKSLICSENENVPAWKNGLVHSFQYVPGMYFFLVKYLTFFSEFFFPAS